MKIRQSTVKDCYYSMQLNFEQPTYHGGSARAVGTGYHYALELYGLERIQRGFWVPEGQDLDFLVDAAQRKFDETAELKPSHESELSKTPGTFKWNKTIPDQETAYGAIDLMVRSYFENGVWPAEWTYLAVEQGFSLPFFNEHTRNGSIDLILQDPNGWIVVDDQKTSGKGWATGKEHPRKNIQAPWYVTAAREMYPDAPGHRMVFSIMTYRGKFERRISDPKPKHEQAADALLRDVTNIYVIAKANGMDLPANPQSTLCSPEYCDWFDICPHGSVLEAE